MNKHNKECGCIDCIAKTDVFAPSQVEPQVRSDSKLSDTAIVEYVTKSFQERTKIPAEWKHLIQQVCSANIGAIAFACGSLELVYRRTLDHAEELRKIDDCRKM